MNLRYYLLKWASLVSGIGVYSAYKEALAWDKLSAEQVKAKQDELLSSLLIHAYRKVPYYKNLLHQSGVYNGKSEPDLSRYHEIPFLTKDILREQYNSLLSNDWQRRGGKPNTSGGSTGEPVRFIQDRVHRQWCVYANKLYYNHKLGKYPGERELLLWGSDRDVLRGSIGIAAKTVNVLYNREFLNAYKMNQEIMAAFIRRINTFQPVAIWAYVESLEELALFAKNHGLSITPPKIIISTAGTLYSEVRELIEGVFGAPVYDQYGSREVGKMACQCLEKDQLHIFPWSHYVEIVNENGDTTPPGQEGEIIVTSLANYAMPLIRYKIGDRAIQPKSACTCGQENQTIESITGRISEHLVALDGTKIYGGYFRYLFFYRPWVKKFQVIQTEIDKVVNRIIINTHPPETDLEEIVMSEKKVLGERVKIRFEFVEDILSSASGKNLYIIYQVGEKGKAGKA